MMVGREGKVLGSEAAGHIASTIMKQKEMNAVLWH